MRAKQLAALFLACLFLALPGAIAWGQSGPIRSSSVQGLLDRRYAKHFLRLTPFDKKRPLRLVLEYDPQNRWELDTAFGFFVFDDAGFADFLGGASPGAVAIAAGDARPGFPRRLQAIIGTPDDDQYHIIVYNDSPVPLGYTLTAENGEIIDDSGRQVVDRFRLPIGAPGSDSPLPLAIAPPPLLPTPTPPRTLLRATALRDRLLRRLDTNYHEIFVADVARPLVVEMTYDPPEQIILPEGLNFYIFSDHQVRTQASCFIAPHLAQNTAVGDRIFENGRLVWRAVITHPDPHYTIVVSQIRYPLIVGYRLSVTNGLLVDGSGSAEAVPQMVLHVPTPEPPTLTPTPTLAHTERPTATPAPVGPPVAGNLVETLAQQSRFQTFTFVLEPAQELTRRLAGDGPFTILAPTESAFDGLDSALLDTLLDEGNPPVEILRYHVIPGRLTMERITGVKQYRTLTGSLVRLERTEDGGLTVNGVAVEAAGIPAANGVIYAIEGVLLPPSSPQVEDLTK